MLVIIGWDLIGFIVFLGGLVVDDFFVLGVFIIIGLVLGFFVLNGLLIFLVIFLFLIELFVCLILLLLVSFELNEFEEKIDFVKLKFEDVL